MAELGGELAGLAERQAELALEIADEAAPGYLDSALLTVRVGDEDWLDLDTMVPEVREDYQGIMSYCALRNLFRRHPEMPNLIQLVEA